MTQGNTGENWNGNTEEKAVNSELEKKFFENKIVPMWASTKVAADVLGITPNALRIRKCRGQIECRYFGNQLRFNISYLQSLFRDERGTSERSS
ncbi:MAG: hypothetical protein AB7O96_08235 [Pseudobdellovibrionaceae bacterium]